MYRKHSVRTFNPHHRFPSFINARRIDYFNSWKVFLQFLSCDFKTPIIMKSLSKLQTWRSLHMKVMELWSQYLLGSELRSDCLLDKNQYDACVLATVFMRRNNYIWANARICKIHPSIYSDAHPSICRDGGRLILLMK